MRRPWALPLVPLYAAGSRLRWMGVRPQRLAWPVVSVGSLSAGGAGKTPFVIALAKLMKREGIYVDVLSRGYGRRDDGAAWVKVDGSADVYGDEPLLITREARTMVYVARERYTAGLLAESLGSTKAVHLLDDGFQHRQLYRAVDIVLVSSGDLDDWLLPVGNRREPVLALRRATIFAVEEQDEAVVARLRSMQLHQPVWLYRRQMIIPAVDGPVVAFCGIARPSQFFGGLERVGVVIAARESFPDHHLYREKDLAALQERGRGSRALAFLTTSKDAVRLGEAAGRLGLPLVVADLQVEFQDPQGMLDWLRPRVA